jgi:hypothetical protein
MFTYLRNLLGQKRGASKPRAASRIRSVSLRLEALEDRLTPSSVAATPALALSAPGIGIIYHYNPFQVSGNTLSVTPITGNNLFKFTEGSGSSTVSLNGASYTFTPAQIKTVIFNGAGGSDQAELTDTVDPAKASISPHAATLTCQNCTVTTNNMYSNSVFGRTGDGATFSDSPGNDTFTASKGLAWMWDSGSTYVNMAKGFSWNYAYSTHGGQDTAVFNATSANDIFEAYPSSAVMMDTGQTYRNDAEGFSTIQGNSSFGGKAYLWDVTGTQSIGGSNLTANGSTVTLWGRNFNGAAYSTTASGFGFVEVYSSGNNLTPDVATVNDNVTDLHLWGWWDVNGSGPEYLP